MKKMGFFNRFSIVLFALFLAVVLTGCLGLWDEEEDVPPPPPVVIPPEEDVPPPPPVVIPPEVSSVISGQVSRVINPDAAVGAVMKAEQAAVVSLPARDALVRITSHDNAGEVLGSASAISRDGGFFAIEVPVDQAGGHLIIDVEKGGFTSFNRRIDYTSPKDINIAVEIAAVEIAVAHLGEVFTASGEPAFKFGIIRLPDGTKRAVAGSKFEIAKAQENVVTELEIEIPGRRIEQGVETLVGRFATFDPSIPEDARNYPGSYLDDEGNKMVSLAFDYIDITDDQGRSIADLITGAAGQAWKAESDPITFTRLLPIGTAGSIIRDEDLDEKGFQIPVYALVWETSRWTKMGNGTVKYADGRLFIPLDETEPVEAVRNFVKGGDAYLHIEVTGEDFLTRWWCTNIPLLFEEPEEFTIKGTVSDGENNPIEGVSIWLWGDDLSHASTVTDGAGEYELITVILDDTEAPVSVTIGYYNPYTFSWGEVTEVELLNDVTIHNITIEDPSDGEVEGRVLNADDTPRAGEMVSISGFSPYYFDSVMTDEDGGFEADVPTNQSLSVDVGSDGIVEKVFNVNDRLEIGEVSDDGKRVDLGDIILKNQAPGAWGYVSPRSVTADTEVTAYLWAWDIDGNYPLSYTVRVEGNIVSESEFDPDGYMERPLPDLKIGSHRISFTVTDSLGESTEFDMGTVEVADINRPPVITIAHPCRDIVELNSYVTLFGGAHDLDGDNLSWRWYANDSPLIDFAGKGDSSISTTASIKPLAEGTVTLKFEVSDDRNNTVSRSFDIFVGVPGDLRIIIR